MKSIKEILIVILLLFSGGATLVVAQAKIESVEAVAITVSDMDKAISFYTHILPFKKISDEEYSGRSIKVLLGYKPVRLRIVKLELGEEKIELIDFINREGRNYPAESHSNDLWFQHIAIITSNMDSAYNYLVRNNVKGISDQPQRLPEWNKNAAGIKAWYFQDPDGHPLEILEFPPDKGNAKWHVPSENLFLGIDHTAIAVSDTKKSLEFYTGILGMKIMGQGENFGIEQKKLNNVKAAHLRITGLSAGKGPGIEFLEYLEPSTGIIYPHNTQINDLIHWQTVVSTASWKELKWKLISEGTDIISLKNVNFFWRKNQTQHAMLVKDPDEHRLLIVEF